MIGSVVATLMVIDDVRVRSDVLCHDVKYGLGGSVGGVCESAGGSFSAVSSPGGVGLRDDSIGWRGYLEFGETGGEIGNGLGHSVELRLHRVVLMWSVVW